MGHLELSSVRTSSRVLGTELPVVALVGRPNAGKSTLFNRLVGERKAIVDEQPGVTRDWNVAPVTYGDHRFLLVDTGGYTDREDSTVIQRVQEQTWLAAEEADVIVALFDGREGLNPLDRDLADRLRRLAKPVVYAVNKLDHPVADVRSGEFFALGIDEIWSISATHGRGLDALMEKVLALLPAPAGTRPQSEGEAAPDEVVRLAIIGRPNVGKSSLLNRLVGYQRAIVDEQPGTTRDAIDTTLQFGERTYILIDTAGVRRRPKVRAIVERASVVRALRAMERAHIALLVIDAVEGMADQDARLARYVWEAGRGLILVLNKWDAVDPRVKDPRYFHERLEEAYPFLADVPRVHLSARTGEGVPALFPTVERLFGRYRFRARTAELNACLQAAVAKRAAPSKQGRPVRFFYATQVDVMPPSIAVFTNHPESIPATYERYLAAEFRARFRWGGIPVRLLFRARERSAAKGRHPSAVR